MHAGYPTLITFGYHTHGSPRTENVSKAYREEGYTITDCHTDKRGFLAKCRDLRKKFTEARATGEPNAVLVTFPGHYLVPLAWLLTRRPRVHLIFDAFISLHDTLVSDRAMYSWFNPFAWFLYLVDFFSCHLADEVLIDTEAHKRFFSRRFFLNPDRIRVIYVGTREDLFNKNVRTEEAPVASATFEVLFIGTYIPLQGIEYIIDAAKVLESESDIHFTFVGGGQTETKVRKKAEDLALRNITFLPFQPLEKLPEFLHRADVALGIFGTTTKADRVIPHKIFDAVACGVPVITARNQAIEEKFHNGREVHLVPPGDPHALAKKILELKGATIPFLRSSGR